MTIETWNGALARQRKIYGTAWGKHLDLLNKELADWGAATVPPTLIPYFWNDPPVATTPPDTTRDYPPVAPKASARTAAFLAHGWIDAPRTVDPPDNGLDAHRRDRDTNLHAIALVLRNRIHLQRIEKIVTPAARNAWEALLRTMTPESNDAFAAKFKRKRIFSTLVKNAEVEVPDMISDSAGCRWMSERISGSLPIRVRARALADAYAFDALDATGKLWSPRVLQKFPNAPSPDGPPGHPQSGHPPEEWGTSATNRIQRLDLHDSWTAQFITDLIAAGLAIEAKEVDRLRDQDLTHALRVLQGAPPVNATLALDAEADELRHLRRTVIQHCADGHDPIAASTVFTTAAAIVGDAFRQGPGYAAKCVLDWFTEDHPDDDPEDPPPTAYTELPPNVRRQARGLTESMIWSVLHGFEE